MKPKPASLQIETELRRSAPASQVPEGLHDDILRAVNAARTAPNPPRPTSGIPLRLALMALLIVTVGLWASLRPGVSTPRLEGMGLALQTTQQMPERASDVVIAPLAQELNFLDRDFRRAVAFVAASVP